jgi:hypothetical protein
MTEGRMRRCAPGSPRPTGKTTREARNAVPVRINLVAQLRYAERKCRESCGTANEHLALKIDRKRHRDIEEEAHGIKRAGSQLRRGR